MPDDMNLTSGALLVCSLGTAPSNLQLIPTAEAVMAGRPTFAKASDAAPYANIMPFGLCRSMANPTAAAAMAAARGAIMPTPCSPVPVSAWFPGSAPTMHSSVMCAWGGMIKCVAPAQAMVEAQIAAAFAAASPATRPVAPGAKPTTTGPR